MAKLIVAAKKLHTIAKSIIFPTCVEIAKTMLGSKEFKEIEKVSLSNNTIYKRMKGCRHRRNINQGNI